MTNTTLWAVSGQTRRSALQQSVLFGMQVIIGINSFQYSAFLVISILF